MSRWRRALRLILPALLVSGFGIGAVQTWLAHIAFEPGPLAAERDIVVPHGDTWQVAQSLRQSGVISSTWQFWLLARRSRNEGPLHAGEFAFPAHATPEDVLHVLRAAQAVEHKVTLPEGLTARQITPILAHADAAEGDVPIVAEGELLPQTYLYRRGATREGIVHQAEAALREVLDREWPRRQAGLPLETPREALILASIVERETAIPDERAHIAAVFLNRLRAGMKLQSDPTVIYGLSDGLGTLDHRLTHADLSDLSPYNTYLVAGLPPGPICAPGLASILAVLHSSESDDLYFVADGTGRHVFARTLAEQNRNVARLSAVTALPPPG
jgi:UPF0755 protein